MKNYEFTLLTDPSGEATGNFTGPSPALLTFEFFRSATNEVGTAVAPLVAGGGFESAALRVALGGATG